MTTIRYNQKLDPGVASQDGLDIDMIFIKLCHLN